MSDKIVQMKLTDIYPYEKNPRFNDASVDNVANSIKEFGFRVPIIVDRNHVIIAGHTRYKAAQKLGMERVPVMVAEDLTPKQVEAYRLADNKVGENSLWDYDLLDGILEELTDFDMAEFGFNTQGFEWKDIEPLSGEEGEVKTAKQLLRCPCCGKVSPRDQFSAVDE